MEENLYIDPDGERDEALESYIIKKVQEGFLVSDDIFVDFLGQYNEKMEQVRKEYYRTKKLKKIKDKNGL